MSRAEWFKAKWRWLKRFAFAALTGAALVAIGLATDAAAPVVAGAFLSMPMIFWLNFIPILHWKERYRGSASSTWGGFLAFEASGWSKLIYWFMHVLPDWRARNQYSDGP